MLLPCSLEQFGIFILTQGYVKKRPVQEVHMSKRVFSGSFVWEMQRFVMQGF